MDNPLSPDGFPKPHPSPLPPVLYEDTSIFVVNKPAGLPSLPDGYDPAAPHLRKVLEPEYGRLWIVHRLDRQTSGVIVMARSAEAHRALNLQFDRRLVEKVYHALVVGEVPWDEQRVDLPLRANAGRRHLTYIDSLKGKPAVTNLQVLERFRCSHGQDHVEALKSTYTLLEARPETGRTHQIRAHLAAAGFPIAADEAYGGGESVILDGELLLARPGLHAFQLTLRHPASGEMMTFTAPYPQDLENTLAMLKKI